MQRLDGVAGRRAIPGDGGEGSRRGTFSTAGEKKKYIYDGLDDRTRDSGVWVDMEELTVGLPKGSWTACGIGWNDGRPDGARRQSGKSYRGPGSCTTQRT